MRKVKIRVEYTESIGERSQFAMMRRGWLCTVVFSISCFGLALISGVSTASPAGRGSAPAVRTAKCTIDIADGKESDCTLIKKNDEWILWMNSSSNPRSVHFKSDENPFTEASCWDVASGARARSGPIALNAALKTYVAHTSDVPCASNPPPNASRGTSKVTIQ
jgi:hypothetical protein